MNRAGAEPSQGVHVQLRSVSLMLGKAVLGVLRVIYETKSVSRYLGKNARCGDGGGNGVSRNDGFARDRDLSCAVSVDQSKVCGDL